MDGGRDLEDPVVWGDHDSLKGQIPQSYVDKVLRAGDEHGLLYIHSPSEFAEV